jgi:tRNA pseudouridine55 synthase
VRAALPALVGEIDQQPPLTSAIKVGGERLYRKARRGESFEPPVRKVLVTRFELIGFDAESQTGELEVACSSGTYVRRLVSDLGELTGAGAYCDALERTAIGPFALAEADEERLVPLSEALSFLPERALTRDEERLARTGRPIEPTGGQEGESQVRLTIEGELVAVAERRDGMLRPVTVIPE